MPIHVLMPALSPTMTEGNLVKWCKKEGDFLKSGEILAEIETDKATMEVEVVDEGVLARILIAEGTENVAVNTLIALIIEEGENPLNLDFFINQDHHTPPSSKSDVHAPIPQESILSNLAPLSEERIIASPLAKRLANEKDIALEGIHGTGPKGRIIAADVISCQAKIVSTPSHNTSSAYTDESLPSMRRIIGKRLQDSKQTIPHFYLSTECCMNALINLRQELPVKISVNDFLVKACALALQKYPKINASWHDTFVRYYASSDICVAVAIEGGLITPIVKAAEQKSIQTISKEIKQLAERARAGSLIPEEYQGGSFTLSNLGMYGVSSFTAIINPPQACILAAASIRTIPIVKDGAIQIGHMTTLTLSADHRIVDGAYAAQFLGEIKELLENPLHLLI